MDDEIIVAEKGDAVFIPKNIEYEFKGSFKAIIINAPAFDPKYDKTRVL